MDDLMASGMASARQALLVGSSAGGDGGPSATVRHEAPLEDDAVIIFAFTCESAMWVNVSLYGPPFSSGTVSGLNSKGIAQFSFLYLSFFVFFHPSLFGPNCLRPIKREKCNLENRPLKGPSSPRPTWGSYKGRVGPPQEP